MANTETTSSSAAAWRPDLATFHASDVVPDALILQCSTVSGRIEGDAPALRVAYVDDDSASFYAEDAPFDEDNAGLNEVTVFTGKVGQLLRVSNEQYRQIGTAEELSRSVQRAIVKKANEAFLTQAAPVGPVVTPPAGLLNVAGAEEGDPVAGNLDALIDLIATLEGNGAAPSHIVLDPTGWAILRKLKTSPEHATTLLGAGTHDAERRLLDLPVIVTPAMSAGSGLVIDRAAVVSAVGDVRVATSEHQYFANDSTGLRATWRIGWNVVRPNRLGTFTVTDLSDDES